MGSPLTDMDFRGKAQVIFYMIDFASLGSAAYDQVRYVALHPALRRKRHLAVLKVGIAEAADFRDRGY